MKMLPIFCISIFFSISSVKCMEKEICLLNQLPEESLLIANQSLVNSMKILMKLSLLNKDFNTVWTVEKIGTLCKNYSDDDRCEAIGWLLRRGAHPRVCKPLIMLLHAGLGEYTDEYNEFVLEKVVGKTGFLPIVQLLFKNKANPNIQTSENYPLLFKVNTVEEAQLFFDNKVNLHVLSGRYNDHYQVNVLWCTVQKDYPSDLMKFYLDHDVDPKKLNHRGECLFHELVNQANLVKDIDDWVKKFELVLGAIPDMINLLAECQTPTGWLMRIAKEEDRQDYKQKYEKFIALFRERGGRTQIELQPWYREGVHNKI